MYKGSEPGEKGLDLVCRDKYIARSTSFCRADYTGGFELIHDLAGTAVADAVLALQLRGGSLALFQRGIRGKEKLGPLFHSRG